jgi:hypothetical protein
MPYNRTNRFTADNISVSIPTGALYDTLFFSYAKRAGTREMLSDLHCIHNKFTPLHKAFALSIKPASIPTGKESKMLIVQMGDDMNKYATSSKWTEGYLTADVTSFGNYFIGIDTVAPVISASGLFSGVNLTGKTEIRIRITDDLSGIKTYWPSIDGNWALFEYDLKNNTLVYTFDKQRLTAGAKHVLALKVTDNKDNTSSYSCDFTW